MAFVSASGKEHGFRAVRCACSVKAGAVRLPKAVAQALGAGVGDRLGVTLLHETARPRRRKPRA
jgi:arginine/ornithine N-succinyltransferase beta subunit